MLFGEVSETTESAFTPPAVRGVRDEAGLSDGASNWGAGPRLTGVWTVVRSVGPWPVGWRAGRRHRRGAQTVSGQSIFGEGKPVPRSTRRSKARSDAVAAEVRLTVALAARDRARGQDEERSEELFRHRHLRALMTFEV